MELPSSFALFSFSEAGEKPYSFNDSFFNFSARAERHVVLLAARKIVQRKRILIVGDDTQIRLNAALENHAGFRLALGADREDAGDFHEILDDLLCVLRFGADEKVDVANRLTATA